MMDSHGHNVKTAYPGMAVTVTGWKTLPNAGDEVLEGTESDIKKAVTNRLRRDEFKATLQDVDAINDQRRLERDRKEENNDAEGVLPAAAQESGPKELRLIVKGDVTGSVEAIVEVLQTIGNKDVSVKVIASGVGDVNESDIMRAQVANGGQL
jgi:translation initiation factor IF-2